MHYNIVFFLWLLSISTLISSSVSDKCHPDDKKVLLRLKNALHNPYLLSSWNPKTDCCRWYSVKCDLNTNRVTQLYVSGEDTLSSHIPRKVDHIPPEVGDLPYLEILEFRKLPILTGTIQPAISKLKNLKYLFLSWSKLSGPVPDFLGQMKSLTYLDLSFNELTGSIPASLSLLPNLEAIHLDRNKLTGSIPESFGSFHPNVPNLFLSHNQLTGPVPKSLGKINFRTIDFSRNKLEGDASFLFGIKTTEHIDLSRNLFKFDLSYVKLSRGLSWLDLNHNKIFGSIPAGLAKVDDLHFLNVSYNSLCGKIPVGGKFSEFDEFSFIHNKCLCGAPLRSCKSTATGNLDMKYLN